MNDDALVPDQLIATARPPQPYPGLRPFEMEEWSIFFGRERMIDDVIEPLARHRLVVVHGASGSGKSSLIRAGVLPRLARQHLRHGVPWRTAAMRPAGGPLWNLAVALARLERRDGDVSRVEMIRRAFDRSGVRLSETVAKEIGLAGQQVCILVDQFEELFRYAREISRDESQLFIELFAGLTEDNGDSGVHAIVTLRSEFLGQCARYDGLAEAINRTQYLLPRMDREGLLRAIHRPAELYGGTIDAELAERLVVDAGGGQDELPLIQHALMLLWNQASEKAGPQRRLGLDLYRRQEGGVAALLSDHADRVLAAAAPDPPQQTVVELLFRALTDINTEGQGTRRPQRFDRLVAATGGDREMLRGIINAFRTEGVSFLTPYPPVPIKDATIVDISHEALIRWWRRIADSKHGWLQREFQDGLIWRSLLAPAERFEKNPQDVLSPALTKDRRMWLEGRPPAWCERYGGGWQAVTKLMEASEAAVTAAQANEKEVIKWIEQVAYYFSTIRRAETLLSDINEILIYTEESADNRDDDWKRAICFFAAEVIDGKVDLAHRLTQGTYHLLESVWLSDVKELKAYYIWKQTKASAADNYHTACEQIRKRLIYCPKNPPEDFKKIENYINDNYITDAALNPDKNATARNLISTKAKRILETIGETDSGNNWESAEKYSKMFYENVIPAVTQKNAEMAKRVLAAFSYSKAAVNCFEAAIAIYFLDAQIIRNLLDQRAFALTMIL